jgi:hypothetical protein
LHQMTNLEDGSRVQLTMVDTLILRPCWLIVPELLAE